MPHRLSLTGVGVHQNQRVRGWVCAMPLLSVQCVYRFKTAML